MAALPGGTLKPADGSAPVTIAPFCMDKFEVTVARYRKCVEAGKCVEPAAYNKENGYIYSNWKHPPPSRENYPVNAIPDRAAAIAMCGFEQKTIPTDPQWEWAARGGPNHWQWPWGNTRPTEDQANLGGTTHCDSPRFQAACLGSLPGYGAGHFEETAPVGSLPNGANPWGVQDLIGNLLEVTSGNYERGGGLSPWPRVRGGYFGSATWAQPEITGLMSMAEDYPGDGDARVGIRCVRAITTIE